MITRWALRCSRLVLAGLAFAGAVHAGGAVVSADQQRRFLTREEILVLGVGLRVEPAQQTVPKNIATIVSTFLASPEPPTDLPAFSPDAEIRGTLRGPTFPGPVELSTKPNSPFEIPALTVAGPHTLENIRLVSGGQIVMYGTPEAVRIDVIDRLLVTQITARPLSAEEIRAKGIVFNKDSFQAFNFTAAFALEDGTPIQVNFPVVLPTLAKTADAELSEVDLSLLDGAALKSLKTLIPDTLRIQTQVPNLSVSGFQLDLQGGESQEFFVPPIPGVIVIPGDIGFLNQFFSVMLMVGNVAPGGSNLVVDQLTATIALPPGTDRVVGSGDDPLRLATLETGPSSGIQPVTQAGADGKLGTPDDITTIAPGETSSAEFLVEGRREGTHVIEMELAGTLLGLPIGPVEVRGRAAGAVLVRNPSFTLTFTHPDVVNAGEPYTLDVTVTNTSESPANFVSLNLNPQQVSGATLSGEPTRTFDSIPPGDSQVATFNLVALRTGRVTAATLESDGQVAGRFEFKTGIGEFGIPLSPDSLVLPREASSLPEHLRNSILGLLGRAWAVATAPASAVPADLIRFSRQVVFDRAVETAEAGFRFSLGEPLPDSAAQLLMDFAGSSYPLVPERVEPDVVSFAQRDVEGFDLLRRRSFRGDVFADSVGRELAVLFGQGNPGAAHRALAEKWSYRPGHVSILLSGIGGAPLPVEAVLVDAAGRTAGDGDAAKIGKAIPFSEVVPIRNETGVVTAWLALIAVPEPGEFTVRLSRRADTPADARYAASVIVPGADGYLHHASVADVGPADVPALPQAPSEPYRVRFELIEPPAPPAPVEAPLSVVADPPPTVLGVVQLADADRVGCSEGATYQAGRIIAVLFSEEVTPESVQDQFKPGDITNFTIEGNRVVGVALQPGRRVVFLALREPIGPFVPRQLTIQNVMDRRGQPIAPVTLPIQATVTDPGGVVTGQVLNADGTPADLAEVRLFYEFRCEGAISSGGGSGIVSIGIASKAVDAEGRFTWDYVLKGPESIKLVAINQETGELRIVRFTIARDGQRLNVNAVLLGRGIYRGRTLAEDGRTPLAGTSLRVTSLTDKSQYGATSDGDGRFEITNVPVGNMLVEAIDPARPAQVFVSETMPFAGAAVERDLILLDLPAPGDVTVQKGALTGRVLLADTLAPVPDVPVVAYYKSRSQPNVKCGQLGPGPEPAECAVAVTRTDVDGRFAFGDLASGEYRVTSFDQEGLTEGVIRIQLPANDTVDFNLLIAGGLGTVRGVVVDQAGQPVRDARVGGGLGITTVDSDGRFVLADVPIGRREIVAASDALGATARVTVDLLRAGDEVNTTIVFAPVGSVAGVVRTHTGAVAPGVTVYVLQTCLDEIGREMICLIGQTVTSPTGTYRVDQLPFGEYIVSAFLRDLSDGNSTQIAVRYHAQVVNGDIVFRGGGGTVTGTVFAADGVTPLKARVSISGDRLIRAGDKIGVKFKRVQNFAVVDSDPTTGRFRFDGVWLGPFTVRAAGAFSPDPISVEGVMPAPGATVNINLRLQPTSVVTGTIFLPDGVTPAGPDVSVKYKSDGFIVLCAEGELFIEECQTIPQGIQEAFATTDAQGRFTFPIVNAGPFSLSVNDPATGRLAMAKGSVRAGETADLGIRLLGRGSIAVTVLSHDGQQPIPGARVEIEQLDYPNKTAVAIANAAGLITFTGGDAFGEGQFVVLATDLGNGFAGRARGRVSSDGETVAVEVRLANATGTVSGFVFRADGLEPVANAEVIISNSEGPLAYAITGEDGSYSESLIPLGAFVVEAFEAATASRASVTGRMDLPDQNVPANLRLDPLAVVRGVVVDSRTLAPLKGWEVLLRQVTSTGRTLPDLRTSTSVDGSFSFPGATTGPFTLTARNRNVVGVGNAASEIVRPGEVVDVPVVVNIDRRVAGRVVGTVFNPDGSIAPSAQVTVCPTGEGCRGNTASSDGTFEFDDIPLGRFTISAEAQITGNVTGGRSAGAVLFEGDTAEVNVALAGLAGVTGQVVRANGSPAPNVSLRFTGQPASGCPGGCTAGTDENGRFSFLNVPARTFTVVATDALSGLRGAVGDTLDPGEVKDVRIVLAAAGAVTGRVLLSDSTPAQGVVAELTKPDGGKLFAGVDEDGRFTFGTVPIGSITLDLRDPIGPGIARRSDTVVGDLDFGDIVLDEQAPAVGETTPATGAIRVPRDQVIRIMFTEPLRAATVNATTVTLVGPAGPVAGIVDLEGGDAIVTLRPLSLLDAETRYTLRIADVEDRVGRKMAAPYVASFTTIDVSAPSIVETTPVASSLGVTVFTTVRVKFSEPIDPAKFAGPAIVLTGPGGAVEGRIDFLFANTVAVFSPARPLEENVSYQVRVEAAEDLSGNRQAQALEFQFGTTDRTPPVIGALVPTGGPAVVENAVKEVVATGVTGDVVLVDFYVNGVLVLADRTAPYALNLQATPQFGVPGQQIVVTAFATDTSANRSSTAASTMLDVLPDAPPVVTIVSPAAGLVVRTGESVTVQVRATDDVALAKVGFKPSTAVPSDAGVRTLTQPATDRIETFIFAVPAGFAPGPLALNASAVDTKGQTGASTPVMLDVIDSTPPAVSITGHNAGVSVRAGQSITVAVTASDVGLLGSIGLTATGAAGFTETRVVDPAQATAVTAFTFPIDAGAASPGQLFVDVFALDRAGNRGAASRLIVPVADDLPPTVALRTASGLLEMVPGRPVTVLADVTDEAGVTRVDLSGSGAFVLTDAKAVSPPSKSTTVSFTIAVPAGLAPGAVLTLSARAADASVNLSTPATLSLTAVALPEVTLPPSALVRAGEIVDATVSLPTPAPAGGLTVTFDSSQPGIAAPVGDVAFAEGEVSRVVQVRGVSGGSASIRARIEGVERASMTVTVVGGVIKGTVLDGELVPAAGVQVTVFHAGAPIATLTDGDGQYLVVGVSGTTASVRAFDPVRQLLGQTTAVFDRANGSASANVVLLAAGILQGTVAEPDGVTSAGENVRVDLFEADRPTVVVATTFTNSESAWEFPMLALGRYIVEASSLTGERGRKEAELSAETPDVSILVTYLGRGTVAGTVRDALGVAVPNAAIELRATSIFGGAPVRVRNAGPDGTFSFDEVLVGSFIVSARDLVSGLAGSASGEVELHQQLVASDVTLAAYGNVRGVIYRADGLTDAGSGVRVVFDACAPGFTTNCRFTTDTDEAGRYQLSFMPFRPFTLRVNDAPTRGMAVGSGNFAAVGESLVIDIALAPQGTLIVTVTDADDLPVAGAKVTATVTEGGLTDQITGTTNATGVVGLQRLLAGPFTVTATKLTRQEAATGTLGGGDVLPVSIVLGARTLTSIAVTPVSVVLPGRGTEQALVVRGTFSDGVVETLSSGVTFTSDAPSVAAVSAAGLVTAGDNGTATITVSANGVADRQVPVLVRSLVGLAISPASVTLVGADRTTQLSVSGVFSDASTVPLTAGVGFTSSDPLVATVDALGLVRSLSTGSATITATFGALPPAQATVLVDSRRAVQLQMTPAGLSFTAAGASQSLTARLVFNDGSIEPATGPVTFTTRNPLVATVTGAGTVTAVASGSTFIDVTAGELAALVGVSVDIPTTTSAPVISNLPRLVAGEGDTFTILGSNFSGSIDGNLVTVNGQTAQVQQARHDRLVAIVPPGATTGPVQVSVDGAASNTLPLSIYARRAEPRLVVEPMALAAAPGQVVDLGTIALDVREGDVVVLSGHPDTVIAPSLAGLVAPEVTGVLLLTIDGVEQVIVPGVSPADLSAQFAAGVHEVRLGVREVNGQVATRGLAIVSGPAGTGSLVGQRWMTANTIGEQKTIRFKLPGVSDGQKVAVTAATWYRLDGGWNNGSAGGAITGGDPTPNDGDFRTFTVVGGEIAVTYSDTGVLAPVGGIVQAVISVVTANAAGSRAGSATPIAAAAVSLGGVDSASVIPASTAQVADGLDRPVSVEVNSIRDANGRLAPDGTMVALTAATWYRNVDGGWHNGSAGGTITGGAATPNDGDFRTFTVAGGRVLATYSPVPVQLSVGDVRTTVISAVTANAAGSRVVTRPFGAGMVTLSSVTATGLVASAQPPAVVAGIVDDRSVVTVSGLSDASGVPVPDGAKFAITAGTWYRASDGGWHNGSAGGTILGGVPTPNDGSFRTFALTGGQLVATYSSAGLVLDPGQTATTYVSVLPASANANRVGTRPIVAVPITLAGVSQASVVPDQSSVVADGGVRPVRVVVSGIRDALGNPVPDGTRVALTADAWYRVADGGWHNGSAGGVFVDGAPTPNDGRFRTYVVTNGRVEATYSPTGVAVGATDVRTTVFSVVVAGTDDNRVTTRPFASGTITLSSATLGVITTTPPSLLADAQARTSQVVITGLTDVAGRPIPDGTKLALTADAWYRVADGGWNNGSAGGTFIDGEPTPNDGRFRTYTVQNQSIVATYSDAGLVQDTFRTAAAIVSVLPAAPNGNRIAERPLLATTITLAGMGSGVYAAPATVAPGGQVTVTFSDIRDALGNVVPDGTRVALTAAAWYRMSDGGWNNNSAGGSFADGVGAPNDGRFKVYVVTGGSITATFVAPGANDVTSVISAVSADGANNRRTDRPFAIGTIRITTGGQ